MLSLGILAPVAVLPVVQTKVVALERTIQPAAVTVYFARSGNQQELRSTAATVGALLAEQGINASPADAIIPSSETPLRDGLQVSYRPAVPVMLKVRGLRQPITTSAPTVGALLAQQNITLESGDYVLPKEDQELRAGELIRVVHVSRWTQHRSEVQAPVVEHRLSLRMAPMATKTIAHGSPTVRDKLVEYTRYDNDAHVNAKIIDSRVVHSGKPKIVLSGIVAYDRYAQIAKRGTRKAMRFATAAMEMVATAYDPHCYGCSGITAIGLPAGQGIVAVDPRVIPLGTRLYIKGYGPALAGDTGGAIKGNRIDLGFDTYAAATAFGRRPVRVYVLTK